MKPVKEPKDIDLIIKSEPWSEEDLADFRKLMQKIKQKNNLKKIKKKNLPKESRIEKPLK